MSRQRKRTKWHDVQERVTGVFDCNTGTWHKTSADLWQSKFNYAVLKLVENREAAYRRALSQAGLEPSAINTMVDADQSWIRNGDGDGR